MSWSPLSVPGPMARTVGDAALLLSAMAGPDDRSPIALGESGKRFAEPLERDFRGVRVAWSPDLGGLPVDPRVTETLEPGRKVLEGLGCRLDDACPDFSDADEIFKTLRALEAEAAFGPAFERAMASPTGALLHLHMPAEMLTPWESIDQARDRT